jgi:hypothetical protein
MNFSEEKKVFAILINYGTELRPFVVNGLGKELSKKYKVIYLVRESELSEYVMFDLSNQSFLFRRERLKNISKISWLKVFLRFNSFFIKQRRARQRKLGYGNFHFSSGSELKTKPFDNLLGSESLYNVFSWLYRLFATRLLSSKYVANIFKENHVTDLLYYGNNSFEVAVFSHTAKSLGLRTWYYLGNWKDIYIDDFIPFLPTKIFVWSDRIKSDLILFNKQIPSGKVVVTGNLFFLNFIDYEPFRDKNHYLRKYGILSDSRFYLWPLTMCSIFPKEIELLRKIDNFIENSYTTDKPVIILRKNPLNLENDQGADYANLKNFFLAENYWSVSKKDDFVFQSLSGEREWGDLLFHCAGVICVPSTVTLESILFKKTTFNILFDESGVHSEYISSFSKSIFYTDLLKREDVLLCESFNIFLAVFNRFSAKNGNFCDIDLPSILTKTADYSIEEFVESLST